MLVSLTQVVSPYGLIGVDLYLTDLIEDVVSYCQQHQQFSYNIGKDSSYAFLIDMNGKTLVHPAFPSYFNDVEQTQSPLHHNSIFSTSSYLIDISYLENATDFPRIRKRMLEEEQGNASTSVLLRRLKDEMLLVRQYQWISVMKMYVLCLVLTHRPETNMKDITEKKTSSPIILSPSSSSSLNLPLFPSNGYKFEAVASVRVAEGYDYVGFNNNNHNNNYIQDLLYHRLDLLPPGSTINVCRYFWRLTTMGKCFLSLLILYEIR